MNRRYGVSFAKVKPAVIVNAAAFSDVDAAERNWDACFALNAIAPVVLAEEAHRLDALLIHYSTDQVFDGNKSAPYTESDPTSPLNVYGASKLAGEQGIAASFARSLILRLGWVYGAQGENFLRSILRLAEHSDELHVASDQIGAPTSTKAIAAATERLIRMYASCRKAQFPTGIYHLAASGATSWHGFAVAIVSAAIPRKKGANRHSDCDARTLFLCQETEEFTALQPEVSEDFRISAGTVATATG